MINCSTLELPVAQIVLRDARLKTVVTERITRRVITARTVVAFTLSPTTREDNGRGFFCSFSEFGSEVLVATITCNFRSSLGYFKLTELDTLISLTLSKSYFRTSQASFESHYHYYTLLFQLISSSMRCSNKFASSFIVTIISTIMWTLKTI